MKLNRRNKKGFTIVELVIVVAVIGILAAILIPTFTNLTNQARANAAKENARNAYQAYLLDANDDSPFDAKAEDQVAVKVGSDYFVYESNDWVNKGSSYTPGDEEGHNPYNGCTLYVKGA